MQVTKILEFPSSYCNLARGIAQVYLLYFFLSGGNNMTPLKNTKISQKSDVFWRKILENIFSVSFKNFQPNFH